LSSVIRLFTVSEGSFSEIGGSKPDHQHTDL
jgi:hypothetical protein